MDFHNLSEPHQNTQKALLEFLLNEKSKHEKSRSKLLKIFKENLYASKSGLEDLLDKLNSNILELDNYFSKIFDAQKAAKLDDDPELSLLNLDPKEAIEKMKMKVPANSYREIKMFCGLSEEIGKMIERYVDNKFEDLKNSIDELRNDFEKEKNKIVNFQQNVQKNKRKSSLSWYLTVAFMLIIISQCYIRYFHSYQPLVDIKNASNDTPSNIESHPEELSRSSVNIELPKSPEHLDKNTYLKSSDELINSSIKGTNNLTKYSSVIESDELIVCSHISRQICSIDIKTLKKRNLNLNSCEGLYSNVFVSTNKSVLFYGIFIYKNLLTNAFILDADKKITKLIWAKESKFPSLAYYENYVYAFGDTVSAKYSYLQNKWENCAPPLWTGLRATSSVGFKNHILIADYSRNLLSYDINQNSFQEVPNLSLHRDVKKLIFVDDNRVYIIEFPGYIYQSAANNFTEWETIATRTITCEGNLWSYIVRFNEKFYFQCISINSSELIEFDLKENALKIVIERFNL